MVWAGQDRVGTEKETTKKYATKDPVAQRRCTVSLRQINEKTGRKQALETDGMKRDRLQSRRQNRRTHSGYPPQCNKYRI